MEDRPHRRWEMSERDEEYGVLNKLREETPQSTFLEDEKNYTTSR